MSEDYFIDYLFSHHVFDNNSDNKSDDKSDDDEPDLIDPDWGKDEDNNGYIMDECGHWSVG